MQFTKSILLATAVIMACACEKEIATTETPQNAESSEIVCIDGTLHFANNNVFYQTIERLVSNANEKEYLYTFETQYGFYSLAHHVDDIYDQLELSESENQYHQIIEHNRQYLSIDDKTGTIYPAVDALGYAMVANIDGVYFIGNTRYKVMPTHLEVHSLDKTRSVSSNCEQLVYAQRQNITRNSNTDIYINRTFNTSDRKIAVQAQVFTYYTVSGQQNGVNVYDVNYKLQFHLSGYKKSWFTGNWRNYKTLLSLNNLVFRYAIPTANGSVVHPEDYWKSSYYKYGDDASYKSSKEVKNFYVNFDLPEIYHNRKNPYMPELLTMRFKAFCRGMGDRGLVVNHGDLCGYAPLQ